MKLILFSLAFLVLAGCYNQAAMVQERYEAIKEEWIKAHPTETLTPEIDAKLKAQALAEEKAARKADLDAAKKDLGNAAQEAATGNYISAGILVVGAIATFFGLRRRGGKTSPSPGGSV